MLCLIVSSYSWRDTSSGDVLVLEIHFHAHSKSFEMTGNTTTTTLLVIDTIFAAGY